jgi:uncharacterized protein (DUF1015 family)
MPELIPFRNFHYKEGKNDPKRLRELIAPPYDVISPEEEEELKKRDPKNICHIILPESYEKAGEKLNEMIKDRTLVTEEDRCVCIYGIEYKHPETGKNIRRYGFVGLLKLVEIFPANDSVIPHEATFRKYTEDRLNLIRETDANFSPIFTIYDGNGSADKIIQKYIKKKPHLQTKDREGFSHKIWEVWKEKDIKKIQEIVRKNSIIIADGHHRYITSLRHSRHGGCKYIMALFIDFNDPGLFIFPNHRQIHNMPIDSIHELKQKTHQYFNIREVGSYKKLRQLLKKFENENVFGCYFHKKFLFLKLKEEIKPELVIPGKKPKEWKNLDLPIIHKILFEKSLEIEKEEISFIKDLKKGLKNVKKGYIDALFIVNPTKLEDIQKITELGEIMPQKSTYFYPKPLSGLVIHKHTDEIE